MGAFTLRGLAKGHVKPNADGTHTIHVTGCSVFVYDTFNFEGDGDYGYWSYEELKFIKRPWGNEKDHLTDAYFRGFRNKYGTGNNFCVYSKLQSVNNFIEMEYKYP